VGDPAALPRFDAARLLALAGVLLVAFGIVVGEIYAIYISHVANAFINRHWLALIDAAGAGNLEALREHFSAIADLTEKRGRTMNSHSHVAAFGLLALALALLQPSLAFSDRARQRLAIVFLAGAVLQVGGVYVSYYTSDLLLYVADAGALLLIGSVVGMLAGLRKPPGLLAGSAGSSQPVHERLVTQLAPASAPFLVKSGLLLILAGMTFGLYYAWQLVSVDEPAVYDSVHRAATALAAADVDTAQSETTRFKRMQSKIAITAAAHSHAIEFGFLMLLLAFVQRYVMLADAWRLRWARVLAIGAWILPVCVLLATRFGLRAAAFSDLFGGFVLVGLGAMAFGLVRYTGAADAATERTT
jgi:hypothetical protein